MKWSLIAGIGLVALFVIIKIITDMFRRLSVYEDLLLSQLRCSGGI